MTLKLTPKELDVLAVVRQRAYEADEHQGEDFVIKADMAEVFLGTILMLAERAEGREFPSTADPGEYLRRRVGKFKDVQFGYR